MSKWINIGLNINPLNFMQFKITDTEPFDAAALGVFNVTGRNMEERELKLWDIAETIVNDKLKSLTYKRIEIYKNKRLRRVTK